MGMTGKVPGHTCNVRRSRFDSDHLHPSVTVRFRDASCARGVGLRKGAGLEGRWCLGYYVKVTVFSGREGAASSILAYSTTQPGGMPMPE